MFCNLLVARCVMFGSEEFCYFSNKWAKICKVNQYFLFCICVFIFVLYPMRHSAIHSSYCVCWKAIIFGYTLYVVEGLFCILYG